MKPGLNQKRTRNRNRRGPRRGGSRRRHQPELPVAVKTRPPLPTELQGQIVLLDQDDFFGIYLDLVMFNFAKPVVQKIVNYGEYKQLRDLIAQKKYQQNIYLIDEIFGWGVIDIPRFVAHIREHDPKAIIVGMTAMAKEDVLTPEIYDKVVVKSRNTREDNLLLYLAEKLNLSLVESNSDPAYKGKEYMAELQSQNDGFPQKIYRDRNAHKSFVF